MDVQASVQQRPASEQPVERRVRSGDLEIAVHDWAGEGRPVLLAHGAGLHGRTWDSVARALPGHRVLAPDLRGHGSSDKPEPPVAWDAFILDLRAAIAGLDLRDVIGVGHSLGGHAVTVAAAAEADRIAGLVLLDPIIIHMPGDDAPPPRPPDAFEFLARRRNEWSSHEEMLERYRDRPPYATWAPGVLDDYVRYGLTANPTGEGYVLSCSPRFEAATYGSRPFPDPVLRAAGSLRVPVRIVRAKQQLPGEQPQAFTTSPTAPRAHTLFHDVHDEVRQDLSHFIPQEDPEYVAQQVMHLDRQLGG